MLSKFRQIGRANRIAPCHGLRFLRYSQAGNARRSFAIDPPVTMRLAAVECEYAL